MNYPPPKSLKAFLKPYEREVQELALKLRALVLEEMAPCYENIYDAYSAVAIGYSPSDCSGDGIFHIAVYSNHVNLGFNDGAMLDDPKRILLGIFVTSRLKQRTTSRGLNCALTFVTHERKRWLTLKS